MGKRTDTVQSAQWEGIIKSVRQQNPRRRRGRFRWLGYLTVMLSVVALIAVSVLAYVHVKVKGNSEDIAALSSRVPPEPMNALIVGSDSRQDLSPEEQAKYDPEGVDRRTGRRADTIILLHLDEKRDKAVLVHFPRDLLVTLPGGDKGRINGSYQQGPGGVIDTVEALTALPIHHYIEVNFTGFKNISNALGGVNVQFQKPINDPDSGLNVPKGCVELKGEMALSFVRSRKIDSDFGRIERQQLFVKLMMDKVTSAGTLLNPIKLVRLVNIFAANLKTDAELSLDDMRKLAFRLRRFDSSNVDMRIIPSSGQRIRGVSYVVQNDKQAKALFEAIRSRDPLPDYGRTGVSALEPSDVRLVVLNGTEVAELAKKTGEALVAKGFQVVGTGNAGSIYPKTTVFFLEGNEEKAKLLAGNYGADVKPLKEPIAEDSEVALVLGTDFVEGRATPPPPPPAGKSQPAAKPLVSPCP